MSDPQHLSSPEQSVISSSWLDRVVTVTLALGNKASLFLKALHAFHHDGHPIPHPLSQAHPPPVCDDADEPHREAFRWEDIWVPHCKARDNPDVAWPHQSGLSCHGEQVLSLFMGAVDQQHLCVDLLQQPSCPDVVHAVGGHVESQHVLQIPYEVAGVGERLNVIHVGFVAGVEAGYDHEAVPVVLLHHLEHAVYLLLNGGAQLKEVGALTLEEEENIVKEMENL